LAAPLLEVDDLQVLFPSREGAVRAVNGVSFALCRDEVLGIIGESGCGKSVTALAILGILPPAARVTGGAVRYYRAGGMVTITAEARASETLKNIRRNDLSMIFQEPMTSFSPVHTIGNQIMEAIGMTDESLRLPKRRRRVKEEGVRPASPSAACLFFCVGHGRTTSGLAILLVRRRAGHGFQDAVEELAVADEAVTLASEALQHRVVVLKGVDAGSQRVDLAVGGLKANATGLELRLGSTGLEHVVFAARDGEVEGQAQHARQEKSFHGHRLLPG